MLDCYGKFKITGECIIIIVTVSCTGDSAEAVKIYQQIETMDTLYGWCGLGLAFHLNSNGQKGLQGCS